uniref:tenascin-like n=1 Tax=Monopterus albus TaxID=43700 RepID=UPI0009B305DD
MVTCSRDCFPGLTPAMIPSVPSLFLVLLLTGPALLTPSTSQELQVRGNRTPRDATQDSVKVVISEGCATQGGTSDVSQGGKELNLAPGSPLVLTHKIKLVPSGSGSGARPCGCEADFVPLRERREREVSALREKCGGAEGGCCTSKESKGAGCSIKPDVDKCPNECSDQGRCVDGKCVCFPGFRGPDCSQSSCPGNCNNNGKCVDGHCVCNPNFTGPDCLQRACTDSCNNQGRCVEEGHCVCNPGFTGPDCSQKACPSNCNNQGRCVEEGHCVCNPGFTGPDCSQKACPSNCNNQGRCVEGHCVCDPNFTGPDCSQRACLDNCNNQGRCVDGRCVCKRGFTGPSCSDKSCPGNCNDRGLCVNGQCVCSPGFTGPDCSKKACPNNCNDRGRCVNGKCACSSGFTGFDCSEISCPGNCNKRGHCVNGQCVCNPGFTGPDCSKRACLDNCSSRGKCVNGKCLCDSGFTGANCSQIACPGNCNKRGRCINGQCVCNDGFTGLNCSEKRCLSDCNNHGKCVNGKCVCDSGFTGADCSQIACPRNCNKRGRCINGQCICNDGFTGLDCSEKRCPNDCNNNGRCVNGKCVCDRSFTGGDCSEIACPGNCNQRGRCINGQCVCDDGFTGLDCLEKRCPNDCNSRGKCVNGKCECDSSFTGADCSEIACPGNCNQRGRCINGQCVCDDGFTGLDCSEKQCPNDCTNHGRCVNGKCVCDSGFTTDDCSEKTCPRNCRNRGRCVNGQCVCDDGFTGTDCSEKACLNNCSNHGMCVNGKCVCNVGFAGPDCTAKSCPNNCNNKGRCIKERCVCQQGFTGQDCSLCKEGMTGPNCDTVMSGVSQLSTQDITETSVTLAWTPPPVQYETYHITFTSQKESDQQITMKVDGRLSTFTQTGLAAGQEYSVTIAGELDGRRGANSSAEFTTLISGPTNLQVVKTTSTSAVVQWEKSHGEIDRYRLAVTPSDGAEGSQEIIIPVEQNSAHIQHLEAGHLYTIAVIAEKDSSRSKPATTQAVPGKTLPMVTSATLTMSVMLAPGEDVGEPDQEFNPSPDVQVSDPHGRKGNRSEADFVKVKGIDGPNKQSSTTVMARPKPLVIKTMATNGTRPKLVQSPTLARKTNISGPFHLNATRVVPGGRKVVPGPLRKPLVGDKKKASIPKKPKPSVFKTGERTTALTPSDLSVETSSSERGDEKHPAIMSRADSETNQHSTSEESTNQPDTGKTGQGNDTAPESLEPRGAIQEKKCVNKTKVTHIRLPLLGKGSKCREDGTVLVGNTLDSDQGSSETDPNGESDPDYTPDPLHKLLTDTYESLNITTFFIHLSKSSNLSTDTETMRKQILSELKPLSSFSSSSSSIATSHLSSSQSSAAPSSSSSSSLVSSSPKTAPLLPSSSSSPPPSSSSSSDKSDSFVSNEKDAENNQHITDVASPRDRKPLLPSREGLKHGYTRHPRPIFGLFQNKTYQNLRIPHRFPPPLNVIPRKETEARHTSTIESSTSSSASNAPEKDATGDTTTPSGAEQNQEKMPKERVRIPVRHPPPKGGYLRRPFPNMGPRRKQTHPNLRLLTRPSRPLSPERETLKQQMPTTTSLPVTKAPYPAGRTGPVGEENKDRGVPRVSPTSMSKQLNQTPRGGRVSSIHHQPNRFNLFHHPQLHGRSSQNRTHLTSRPPQHPNRGLMRKPYITRKIIGGSGITAGNQTSQIRQDSTPEIPHNQQPGERDVPRATQEVQIIQSGRKESANIIATSQKGGHDTTIRPQMNELDKGVDVVQTTKSGKEETSIPTIKQTSSDSAASRPAMLPKKQLPTRSMTGPRGEDPKTINTARTVFDGKTAQTRSPAFSPMKGPDVVSPGVTREPLDYVNVTNQTSDGFTLIWGSPEGKYKNFVVTMKEAGKDDGSKVTEGRKDQQREGKHEDFDKDGDNEDEEAKHQPTKEAENINSEDENTLPESAVTHIPRKQSGTAAKPATESNKTLKKILPGLSRSFHFEDLSPQTEYTVTVLGKGPGVLSRLEKLVISTGPEPPSNIVFSKVTENSVTVSWTKPKTPVSGFKLTYAHAEDGEPVPVSLDTEGTTFDLSQLSPGSSYEVSVISILEQNESEPVKESVTTLPDPPTDLRVINITDTKALLLWRPALAAADKYAIVYGSGTGSEVRISVSGNAAEQQLSDLQGSTTYTVTITSQQGSLESSPASTSFTTTSGKDRDGPRDLRAINVTPRTALLSWKRPPKPVESYRLTYQTKGQERKEVTVNASATEYNLTRLLPGSKYRVQLQAEGGGQSTSSVSTNFTT